MAKPYKPTVRPAKPKSKKNWEFGIAQIANKTPLWAKWVFRIVMMVTTAISAWIASTALLTYEVKVELILVMKILDPLLFGISKLFGVEGEPAGE